MAARPPACRRRRRRRNAEDAALLLFNNGMAGPATVTCDGACWARMWPDAGAAVAVRYVLARTDNGTTAGGFSATVRVNATVVVRLRLNGTAAA